MSGGVVAIIGVDTLHNAEIGQIKAAYLIGSSKTIHNFQKNVDRSRFVVYMHTKMTKELDLAAMENCVCFNLRWVTRAVTQFFDAELRRYGIRPTQTPVLAALTAKPGWSMEELSDWLGMERTTLVRNLRPLERDGLVDIAGAGRGGRVSVSISAKGKKDLEKARPAWRAAQQAVIKTLGRERWSAILSDLDRAALALTNLNPTN